MIFSCYAHHLCAPVALQPSLVCLTAFLCIHLPMLVWHLSHDLFPYHCVSTPLFPSLFLHLLLPPSNWFSSWASIPIHLPLQSFFCIASCLTHGFITFSVFQLIFRHFPFIHLSLFNHLSFYPSLGIPSWHIVRLPTPSHFLQRCFSLSLRFPFCLAMLPSLCVCLILGLSLHPSTHLSVHIHTSISPPQVMLPTSISSYFVSSFPPISVIV